MYKRQVPPTVTVTENGKVVENGYKTWITGKEDNIVITGNVTDAGTEGSNYPVSYTHLIELL